jgi:hypothetical protein
VGVFFHKNIVYSGEKYRVQWQECTAHIALTYATL